MTARPILGVSGHKRTGKDTLAERLVTERGYTRVAFADTMREMAYALDPVVDVRAPGWRRWRKTELVTLASLVDEIGWERAKEEYPLVRRTLQRLGTEAGRNVLGPDFWVEQGMRKAAEANGPVVFTDVRFPNEAHAILQAGGFVARVERPGLAPSGDLHESETALDDRHDLFAVVVVNDGAVADLHAAADVVADRDLEGPTLGTVIRASTLRHTGGASGPNDGRQTQEDHHG